MAPPIKELDADLIFDLASNGYIQEEIAYVCGVCVDTLVARYSEVLKRGRLELNSSLRRKQVELAKTGNTTMLVWLGKILLGQKETQTYDVRTVKGYGDLPITEHRLGEADKPN